MVAGLNFLRSRVFGSKKGQLDLNWLWIGRYDGGQPVGRLHENRRIRTGFFRGGSTMGSIPSTFIESVPAGIFPQHPDGIDIIYPYDKTSPGYRYFISLPKVKLKIQEQQMEVMKIRLTDMIETVGMQTPEQLKENLMEVLDIMEKIFAKGTMIRAPPMTTVSPEELGR